MFMIFLPRRILRRMVSLGRFKKVERFDYETLKESELNRLADCVEQHLDWENLAQYLPT